MKRLDGKVAIVLGAAGSGNMGQAIARRFHGDGARVIVAGRREAELQSLATSIDGVACRCDIRSESDLAALAQLALERFSRLDVAVNCVGAALFKPFLETTTEELRRIIDVQFTGPFQFLQAMARVMTNGGSLIQISSITAKLILHDHAAYMGTKAGIDQVVRSAANDLGHRGIRVNTIAPGLTDTPMNATAKATPGFFDAFMPYAPLGRLGTVEHIAAAAAWLASDECFMTGATLVIDGGMTLRGLPLPAVIQKSVQDASHLK